MCFVYDEYAELYREKKIKAKKEHLCTECNKTIFKNETYQYVFTIFQGDATSIKVCSICQDKRQKIHDIEINHGCSESESWPPLGELKECLQYYGLGE